AVWSDVVVTDGSLSQGIRILRRALGDDPREPRFIRTLSRHGYRFIEPGVLEEDDTAPLPAADEASHRHRGLPAADATAASPRSDGRAPAGATMIAPSDARSAPDRPAGPGGAAGAVDAGALGAMRFGAAAALPAEAVAAGTIPGETDAAADPFR